jgi:molecular chaperone DnaJ
VIQSSSVMEDPYAVLGIPRDASEQAIKQAYRRIALDCHPDRNSKDPAAAERFRRASLSYALLRDPERRQAFDRTGRWDDARWAPSELDVQIAEALEIFARDFGAAVEIPIRDDQAPAHTGRGTIPVDVSYEDVERGARRQVPAPCRLCLGSGARDGSSQVRCTTCGGSGRLRNVESSFLGPQIRTEVCESCRGSGRRPLTPCPGCDGSGRSPNAMTVDVLIPRGTADGDPLTGIGTHGSQFFARLVEDQRWGRDGADLYATRRIPYGLAVLGGPVKVELPGRTYSVEVAAGTVSGHRSRIAGQGLPLPNGDGRGDLVLTLHVAVPKRVGMLERWFLRARWGRSAAATRPTPAIPLPRLQARAWAFATSQWQQWRKHHHQSSLLRIERAAESLRAVAGQLSESEQRLGPLVERAFPLIAPAAAQARSRLEGGVSRARKSALAAFAVDGALATALVVGLWVGARYAAPAVTAVGGGPLWNVIRAMHPASFALLPLMAGLAAGAIPTTTERTWVLRVAAVPIGLTLGAATLATGTAAFAAGMRIVPEASIMIIAAVSGTLAAAAGVAPAILFLLGSSLVGSARGAFEESSDRVDLRTLRRYDTAAARLATYLEGTERAFRQLLTRADDARHPLTSLLNGAADTLAVDHHRRPPSTVFQAALALAASVAVTGGWVAATTLAVVTAFTLLPETAMWSRLATTAAVAGMCTLGGLMPPAFLPRHRIRGYITGLATIVAVLALIGILAIDPVGSGPAAGWLAAGAATAALGLSFRLPESIRATAVAVGIVSSGTVAVILWPFALAFTAFRGGAQGGTSGETRTPTPSPATEPSGPLGR